MYESVFVGSTEAQTVFALDTSAKLQVLWRRRLPLDVSVSARRIDISKSLNEAELTVTVEVEPLVSLAIVPTQRDRARADGVQQSGQSGQITQDIFILDGSSGAILQRPSITDIVSRLYVANSPRLTFLAAAHRQLSA